MCNFGLQKVILWTFFDTFFPDGIANGWLTAQNKLLFFCWNFTTITLFHIPSSAFTYLRLPVKSNKRPDSHLHYHPPPLLYVHISLLHSLSQLFPCDKLNHLSLFALEDKAYTLWAHTGNTHKVVTRVFSNASQMFNLSLHQITRLQAGDKDSEWKEEETKTWREGEGVKNDSGGNKVKRRGVESGIGAEKGRTDIWSFFGSPQWLGSHWVGASHLPIWANMCQCMPCWANACCPGQSFEKSKKKVKKKKKERSKALVLTLWCWRGFKVLWNTVWLGRYMEDRAKAGWEEGQRRKCENQATVPVLETQLCKAKVEVWSSQLFPVSPSGTLGLWSAKSLTEIMLRLTEHDFSPWKRSTDILRRSVWIMLCGPVGFYM